MFVHIQQKYNSTPIFTRPLSFKREISLILDKHCKGKNKGRELVLTEKKGKKHENIGYPGIPDSTP